MVLNLDELLFFREDNAEQERSNSNIKLDLTKVDKKIMTNNLESPLNDVIFRDC